MKSRVRFGLLTSAIVLFLLGLAAISVTVLGLFNSVSNLTLDSATGDVLQPSKVDQLATTLAPVSGAVFLVLAVLCVLGAIASWVSTEAVDRAAASRAGAVNASRAPSHAAPIPPTPGPTTFFSATEHLDNG
jgi:hypothetical protein